MSWKFVLILILSLAIIIFVVQNYEVVKIQFFFWSLQTSRAIVIFSSLLIGVIIGWVVSFRRRE